MSKLYIMMGIPGSGKSTWCRHNIKDTDAYVSRDKIRFGLVNPNEPYFSKENQVYREFINTIERKLVKYKNVYADQTSLDSRARRKLITSLHIKLGIILVYKLPILSIIKSALLISFITSSNTLGSSL